MKKFLKIILLILILLFLTFSIYWYTTEKDYFTFIVLPDTQFYSEKYPLVHFSQVDWIANNIKKKNIKGVITLGDIVQNDDDNEYEWINASDSYSVLDLINIPYNITPGNHDLTSKGVSKYYNEYFPPKRFKDQTWYGDYFGDNNRNNFITIHTPYSDFIIVSLEYCPPDNAVTWAKNIFNIHQDKVGILVTHAFLNEDGERMDDCNRHSLGDNTGVDMWNKIVIPSENIQIVLNGHFHHELGGTYTPENIGNRTVHQIMANYQDFDNGGNGFLRIMKFKPKKDSINVTVSEYSPYIKGTLSIDDLHFELTTTQTRY